MKKKREVLVGTWYAQRETATGKWWDGWWVLEPSDRSSTRGDESRPMVHGDGRFAEAYLTPERKRHKGFRAVPVRCRPLSAKSKRSKKRTR